MAGISDSLMNSLATWLKQIRNHSPLETETPPRDSVKSGLRSKIMLGLKPLKPGRQARYKKATIYKLMKRKLKRKTYLLSNDFPDFPILRF